MIAPGIYTMSMDEYLKIDALSSGTVHTLLSESPYHARHAQIEERTSSKEADIGTYAHAMLLEGGTDALAIIDAPDWRTKAAKEQRDIARAENMLPVLAHKVDEVRAMVAAALYYVGNSDIAGVFEDGAAEKTLIWQEGGVLCKARPDWLSDHYMIHFKTTMASVNPRAFSRIITNSGYARAMMFYHRGLEALIPDNDVAHYILAQEQSAPNSCKLYDLANSAADIAEREVERAIGIWAKCLASGVYPTYDGSVYSVEATPWDIAKAEEDMLGGDLTDDELAGGVPA